MASYYREFCPNLASVSALLADLLKGDVKYVWSSICQQAFNQLKDLLSSAPVLATPWLDRPFKLQVDAGDAGVGAVLLQVDESCVLTHNHTHSQALDIHTSMPHYIRTANSLF